MRLTTFHGSEVIERHVEASSLGDRFRRGTQRVSRGAENRECNGRTAFDLESKVLIFNDLVLVIHVEVEAELLQIRSIEFLGSAKKPTNITDR